MPGSSCVQCGVDNWKTKSTCQAAVGTVSPWVSGPVALRIPRNPTGNKKIANDKEIQNTPHHLCALSNYHLHLVAVLVRTSQERLGLGLNQVGHTLLRPLEQTILLSLLLISLFRCPRTPRSFPP